MAIRPITFLMSIINSQNMKLMESNNHIKNIQQAQIISEQNLRANGSVTRISKSDFENDADISLLRQGSSDQKSNFYENCGHNHDNNNNNNEPKHKDATSLDIDGSTIDIIT